MAELDFGGGSYKEQVTEVAELATGLLRNGVSANATLVMIEHFGRQDLPRMENEQFARFSGEAAWRGATTIISDPDANPRHAYDLLALQTNSVSHARNLAEYGKGLDRSNHGSERPHIVLRMASKAFVEILLDEMQQEQPLEQRITFYVKECARVADLQKRAGDLEGGAITADRIVDAGESLFIEARSSGDERLARQMNDSLRELAGSLSGGIEDPKTQRLLRITSAEGKALDFLELRKLEDTANTLLKSGMVDTAFKIYELTRNFDPDEVRRKMQERGKRSDEEIDEHIRLVTGSFPGNPWDAILDMQQQPDTEEYVSQILDRIKDEYPTTYEWFSYDQNMRDRAAYAVLMNANRSEELAEIVPGTTRDEESPNLRFMAGSMAAMIMDASK